MKLLVYKDCKKNIHRVMKFRADRKNANNANSESATDLSVDVDGQFLKDNLTTMEKMHQLRTQLELKKKDKQNSKWNVAGGRAVESSPSSTATHNSFGEQCVNNLLLMTKNESEQRCGDGASNSGATKKDGGHADYWNVSSPVARRMYFPPLKIPGDGQAPFNKPVDGSALLKKPIRNEFTSFTNEFSNYPITGRILNKHGTAKTCLRSSMLTQKQKPSTEVTPPTTGMLSSTALFDADPSSADMETFQLRQKSANSDEALKTKAFGQHLIELIRTSKMPLSPSWQDISDAKAKFEATFVPSMAAGTAITTQKSNSSNGIATAGASSTTSLNELHVLPLSQSMTTMTAAATATRNFTNSEVHRSKIRDNIRRNRSFKALISNDYIIEENNHHNHQHHQHQQQHQYQSASSTAAASMSSFNSSRQYSSSAKKSRVPFNSVQDLLEKFNSSTKLKGNNAHGNAAGGFNCHYNDVRSNESLGDPAKLSNPSPFRANSGKSSLFIDLKPQFDTSAQVKCSRRMSTPKFAYNGFENKLFVENPSSGTTAPPTHPHHHASMGSRDKRKSFSGGEYKFDGATVMNTSAGAAAATPIGASATATATAIADSSSFRVFKMTSDGEYPRH